MAAIKPTHPGEILREEFLKPLGISAYRLAKSIDVPVNRITAIINEERDISAETALLLARFFGVSDSLWLNLQQHYDLEHARDALAGKLKRVKVWRDSRRLQQTF
jgi:addiction module HigA family antidote